MEKNELPEELWGACFPIANFYVRCIAPIILTCFIYAIARLGFIRDYSVNDAVAAFTVIGLTWFYGDCFVALKNKKPVAIGGGGLSIKAHDTASWARFIVCIAIFAHAALSIGLTLGLAFN